MDEIYGSFLRVLRAAIRGDKIRADESLRQQFPKLYRLAAEHHILPLIADCLYDETQKGAALYARQATVSQARRTADFLLLMQKFASHGLRPVIVKGIVCRSLYPEPEQRPSEDEDLLIRPADYPAYKAILEENGLHASGNEDDYEVSFATEDRCLHLELHRSLFPPESDAYGDCARFFDGALDRAVELRVMDVPLLTLAPTDHLLFLLCHAYKHFLHGGIGIRQLCDMALMAERDDAQIDWAQIRGSCEELRIAFFAAALFRIAERQLGFAMPEAFAELEVDESDLLDDMLSGGLYGGVDIDRAHSSTMTLEAVVAARSGRRRRGALHSLFLPLSSMRGHFPYLKKYPWLLPWAWLQRIWRYLRRKKNPSPVSPTRSIRIARERIELLREYHIVES
ncbi:MAG: nucleotidyltransferase family protein [Oscillospiraceae bacterium]|nr:nucleotidyltransferase family protein [Oscillospiraceae bacterium]